MSDSQTQQNPPLDSDQQYRHRLAQTAIAMCCGDAKHPCCPEIVQLLESGTYAGTEDVVRGQFLDEAALIRNFQRHPDLQSRIALLTQYTPGKWLLEQEFKARLDPKNPGKRLIDPADTTTDVYDRAKTVRDVGVCLSGGGIRSATFNLGVLQGLAQLRKLGEIDYLSSVSGGGYIHQFLASWIKRAGIASVQEKMVPIPAADSGRIIPPEPIRWLRRYSNYLSPSVSLFGADVWTIFTVWIRNMLLNLVILISAIMTLLLLPHAAVTEWVVRHLGVGSVGSITVRLLIFALLAGIGLWAAGVLWYAFPRFCDAVTEADKKTRKARCGDRTHPWHVHAIVASWLLLAACAAPVVYKLSVPGGSQFSRRANRAYAQRPRQQLPADRVIVQANSDTTKAEWTICKDQGDSCKSVSSQNDMRLAHAWSDYKPKCSVPAMLQAKWIPCEATHQAYVDRHLITPQSTWLDESPLIWLYDAFPLLCVLFCLAIWAGHKESATLRWKVTSLLFPLFGGIFCIVLLYGIGYLFFVGTFLVHQKLIASLGIAVLPSLLLAVPFISLELCTGLMGTLFGSAQREWVARLRAVSVQYGVVWFALFGVSLLGRYVSELIAQQVIVKYAVWSTWVVSTISGVLLGKSRLTSGKPNEDPDAPGQGGSWSPAELVVKVAPPIFIVGLFVLLATLISWLLEGNDQRVVMEVTSRWAWLLLAMVATSFFFSSRIDINEFSMNAFYRDRLARCYAGASNPNRVPNRFTGFDVEDGRLRVKDLVPSSWVDLNGQPGAYQGPFPIFCTALNLTTGRELAYQERKAASFAITPLYSGYSTGWTDGTNDTLQYNGFVPTIDHIKRGKGITVASTVAISGAAASPNMGFHSSKAMAFLMTVFNVRLGWWIRNPRRAGIPDYPRNGLAQLVKELWGVTNDTAGYVYLSDGGHFENMGLYELLRRRCRTVIVCDAEADGSLRFEGIGMAIRKVRVDFGIEIRIRSTVDYPTPGGEGSTGSDKAPLQEKPNENEPLQVEIVEPPVDAVANLPPNQHQPSGAEGLLKFKHCPGNLFHALEADIYYPEDKRGEPYGKLLYLKSTLTGDEPADILNYHRVHNAFPFDTTLDQFFTESQFESYRRLGEHIILKKEIQDWVKEHVQ
ncbi:hypothetical protein AB4043_18290 [Terriglobus sp. YAF25]|uniref:hypothetical protein n=1 Tax=Terriglobus sp. YAF25 TaxID=3233080 RepID=UPI003F9EAA89